MAIGLNTFAVRILVCMCVRTYAPLLLEVWDKGSFSAWILYVLWLSLQSCVLCPSEHTFTIAVYFLPSCLTQFFWEVQVYTFSALGPAFLGSTYVSLLPLYEKWPKAFSAPLKYFFARSSFFSLFLKFNFQSIHFWRFVHWSVAHAGDLEDNPWIQVCLIVSFCLDTACR